MKKIFTLIAIAATTLSANAEDTLNKLYIIGDMNGWNRSAMTEMTFNEQANAFEYESTSDKTVYFAFADKQLSDEEAASDGNWSVFNSTYRYAIAEGNQNATLDTETQLIKANGTIVLSPGSYKISVTKDLKMTITGKAAEVGETIYSIIGTINGNWDTDTDMTKNSDGTYSATFENLAAGTYKFKVRVNHDWGENYGSGDDSDGNTVINLDEASKVVITFNPDTKLISIAISAATGISNIKAGQTNAVKINLAGQQVGKNYKGVVIMNGKKMIQK